MWRIVNNSKSLITVGIFLMFFMWITMLEIWFSTRNYSEKFSTQTNDCGKVYNFAKYR